MHRTGEYCGFPKNDDFACMPSAQGRGKKQHRKLCSSIHRGPRIYLRSFVFPRGGEGSRPHPRNTLLRAIPT